MRRNKSPYSAPKPALLKSLLQEPHDVAKTDDLYISTTATLMAGSNSTQAYINTQNTARWESCSTSSFVSSHGISISIQINDLKLRHSLIATYLTLERVKCSDIWCATSSDYKDLRNR